MSPPANPRENREGLPPRSPQLQTMSPPAAHASPYRSPPRLPQSPLQDLPSSPRPPPPPSSQTSGPRSSEADRPPRPFDPQQPNSSRGEQRYDVPRKYFRFRGQNPEQFVEHTPDGPRVLSEADKERRFENELRALRNDVGLPPMLFRLKWRAGDNSPAARSARRQAVRLLSALLSRADPTPVHLRVYPLACFAEVVRVLAQERPPVEPASGGLNLIVEEVNARDKKSRPGPELCLAPDHARGWPGLLCWLATALPVRQLGFVVAHQQKDEAQLAVRAAVHAAPLRHVAVFDQAVTERKRMATGSTAAAVRDRGAAGEGWGVVASRHPGGEVTEYTLLHTSAEIAYTTLSWPTLPEDDVPHSDSNSGGGSRGTQRVVSGGGTIFTRVGDLRDTQSRPELGRQGYAPLRGALPQGAVWWLLDEAGLWLHNDSDDILCAAVDAGDGLRAPRRTLRISDGGKLEAPLLPRRRTLFLKGASARVAVDSVRVRTADLGWRAQWAGRFIDECERRLVKERKDMGAAQAVADELAAVDACVEEDRQYVDEAFLTDNSQTVEHWLRPHDVLQNPALFVLEEFGGADVSAGDVTQGMLRNCWLLSAAAAVAEKDPRLIGRVLRACRDAARAPREVTRRRRNHGGLEARLYRQGWLESVVIDTLLPCRLDRHSIELKFGCNGRLDNELWCALVEKAVAKLFGGYQQLGKDTDPFFGLACLTGYPAEQWPSSRPPQNLPAWQDWTREDWFDHTLLPAVRAGCAATVLTATEHEYREVGLHAAHAYTVLDACGVQGADGRALRMLLVRNPHGASGVSSVDGHPMMWCRGTPPLMEPLPPAPDAAAWMEWADVVRWFQGGATCRVRGMDRWRSVRVRSAWDPATGPAHVIRVDVRRDSDAVVQVHQPDMYARGNGNGGAEPLSVAILEPVDGGRYRVATKSANGVMWQLDTVGVRYKFRYQSPQQRPYYIIWTAYPDSNIWPGPWAAPWAGGPMSARGINLSVHSEHSFAKFSFHATPLEYVNAYTQHDVPTGSPPFYFPADLPPAHPRCGAQVDDDPTVFRRDEIDITAPPLLLPVP